eukprot:NODE_4495_length_779_cov_23.374233_g4336_i0.p1 GENE.NODE_4495_length_779_cov_23.374233_g4336_i0~~NODE_4495_length_779_cov_23.374233_g4336_i0.p1  ORF type:complete len:240 (+),score=53.97 NODE_4495_length_779_cov_23.374233_g4336_i0:72-722(+)
MPCPPKFLEACAGVGVALTPSQVGTLAHYLTLLLQVNGWFRVTIDDPDRAWFRHFLDSLALARFIRNCNTPTPTVVDVGTGPGLPGIPLAIAMPDAHFYLLERRAKVTDWLALTAKALNLNNITVITNRVQDLERTHVCHFDAVVVRRVGSTQELLQWTYPILRPGGRLIAMKGKQAEAEVAAAIAPGWSITVSKSLPDDPECSATVVDALKIELN